MTQQARIKKGLYWDRAWSLVEGCASVSPGCDHCWAAQQAHVRAGQKNEKIRARYGGLTDDAGRWTGKVRLMIDDLGKPGSVRKPTTWAIWNDLFHPGVPPWFICKTWRVMRGNPRHTFLVLTKRPRQMAKVITTYIASDALSFKSLPNVWLGVTVEHPDYLHRIDELFKSPAALYYVSVEPMLAGIDLDPYFCQWRCPECFEWQHTSTFCGGCGTEQWENIDAAEKRGLSQVICGAETGHHKRPMELDWARDLRNQCQAAGVPFFFKKDSAGSRLLDGRTWNEMPLRPA